MKKALIIIDLIEDIIGQHTANYEQVKERRIIEQTNKIVKLARLEKIPIVWVKVGFADDYHDILRYSPMFNQVKQKGTLKLSSSGCNWVTGIEIKEHDLQIVKKGVGAFAGNNLLEILQSQNINHLMICGVSSTMTIESTTRLAHDLGYKVTVLEDACSANTQLLHQQSMDKLAAMAEIVTVEQLI